jgi:hypothetical protein
MRRPRETVTFIQTWRAEPCACSKQGCRTASHLCTNTRAKVSSATCCLYKPRSFAPHSKRHAPYSRESTQQHGCASSSRLGSSVAHSRITCSGCGAQVAYCVAICAVLCTSACSCLGNTPRYLGRLYILLRGNSTHTSQHMPILLMLAPCRSPRWAVR